MPNSGPQLVLEPSDLGIGLLFDLEADAIVVGDAGTGRIVMWNPAASRIFGYERSEAIGMLIEELVPPELVAQHRAGLARYFKGETTALVGNTSTLEVPGIRRDGTRLWIELSLTSIASPVRPQRLVLALIRDATERRAAQLRADAAGQALREFIAMAAHDLRDPLTVIGHCAYLLAETPLESDARQLNEIIGRQHAYLSTMVDDLVLISQLDARAIVPNRTPVNLGDVAALAVESAGADIDVTVSLHAEPRAAVDAGHLQRILSNLVANAARYGAPPITLSAERRGSAIEVRVSDCGPGVPEEFIPRLFEKFTRARPEGERAGTGLGLAICRGLAQANGGDVRYEPRSPTGACFVLDIPAA